MSHSARMAPALLAGLVLIGAVAHAEPQFAPPGGLSSGTPVGTQGATLATMQDGIERNARDIATLGQTGVTKDDLTAAMTGLQRADASAMTIGNGAQTVQEIASENVGTVWHAKWERQDVAAGASFTLADVSNGPGYAQTINMALAGGGADVDRTSIAYYVDGETTPSVTTLYGLIGTYGGYAFASKHVTCAGGRGRSWAGCTYSLRVPYKRSLRIVLTNNGGGNVRLWGAVQGNAGGHQFLDRYAVAHAVTLGDQYAKQVKVKALEEYTLLDVTGRGAFWGMQFFMDRHNNAAGADENCIEGNFRYYVDGATKPSYESSGTEDYFGSAFEFMSAGFAGATGAQTPYATESFGTFYNQWSNATGPNAIDDQSSAFRFHSADPVHFNRSLKVTWQCGEPDNGLTTNTAAGIAATLYYYTDR